MDWSWRVEIQDREMSKNAKTDPHDTVYVTWVPRMSRPHGLLRFLSESKLS